jgi:hypothetical protein
VDASSTVVLLNMTAGTTLNTVTGVTTTTSTVISALPAVNYNFTLDISISKGAATTYADRILEGISTIFANQKSCHRPLRLHYVRAAFS